MTIDQSHSITTCNLSRSDRRLLGLVFQRGSVLQSAIVDEMELTQQSVSRLVTGLIDKGFLKQGDRVSAGKRGYPATTIRLAPDFATSAGVAIHADSIGLALIDFSGTVQIERKASLPSMSVAAVTDWIAAVLAETCTALGIAPVDLTGIGISLAGSFLGEEVGFNTPRSLDDWANIDVARLIGERLKLPAWIDNDGNNAALAESINGVGRWASSFAYLYLSAGIGGGVVLNGQVWRGRFGNAGEFAGGLPSNIYPFPNLELLRQMLARDGILFDTVQAMVESYEPAWPAIDGWIARVRDSVSIMASNATAILDLEAIVLGGQTPADLARRLIPCIELFDQKRRAQVRPMASLVPAETVGDAAAIGAAMLPLRATYFR